MPATERGNPPSSTASPATPGSALLANRPWLLLRLVLSRAAQTTHTINDAVAIRVPNCLDQMATFVTVVAFGQRGSARGQMPFDAVAFTAGAHLAASPYDRPPEDALGGWHGLTRLRVRRGPLTATTWRRGIDGGCSHGLDGTSCTWIGSARASQDWCQSLRF